MIIPQTGFDGEKNDLQGNTLGKNVLHCKKNSHDVQCLKTIQRFAKKNSSRFNQTTHIPVKGKWSTSKYTKEGSLKREQPYE